MANKFKVKDEVALKEDPKIKGKIVNIHQPYDKTETLMYYVRWKNFSQDYTYLEEALISPSEIAK